MRRKPRYSTVMLVDDSEVDNFINQKMMEGCNFASTIHIHTSGKSALESLKNMERAKGNAVNFRPEIVFLDINMPMMDGFQFIEEFEKLGEKFSKEIKIIILTSSINQDDEAKSKKYSHVSGYLIKPLNQAALDSI